jgi:phosphohistidine phosphatase
MYRNTKKKQIILVRHAKAVERIDWNGRDFDRPILPIGDRSNNIVANYLRLIGLKPDRIIASPAVRTRVTAEGMADKLGLEEVEYIDDLYNEWPSLLRCGDTVHLDAVKKTKKACQTVMIVWHNPDLTDFSNYLSWDTIPSMKKWSVIVLSLPEDAEWKDLAPGTCKFIYYLTPQFLKLEDLA